MCVAITLLSKSDRLLSGQRLFGSFERVRKRKKQVEVHALLHVVVPGAARYAKRSSFGLRHHFAFNLALESVLRVRRVAYAGIDPRLGCAINWSQNRVTRLTESQTPQLSSLRSY